MNHVEALFDAPRAFAILTFECRHLCSAVDRDELWLVNAYIPEYTQGNRFNHEPRRKRKLLLHRRQISRLTGAIQREGYTLVPLSIFFNDRGMAKVELGLAKGKKQHDKRDTEKARDWQRTRQRLLKRGE